MMHENGNEVAGLLGDKLQSTTPWTQDDRAYFRMPAIAALYIYRCGRAWVQRLFRVSPVRLIILSFIVVHLVLPIFWGLPTKLIMSWVALLLLGAGASMHMWDCLLGMGVLGWSLFTWPLSLQVSSIRQQLPFIQWTDTLSHAQFMHFALRAEELELRDHFLNGNSLIHLVLVSS